MSRSENKKLSHVKQAGLRKLAQGRTVGRASSFVKFNSIISKIAVRVCVSTRIVLSIHSEIIFIYMYFLLY